jgi:hypothetical protein
VKKQLNAGSTYAWTLQASRNGSVWDLTGATVTLRLWDPAGNLSTFPMPLTDPTNGLAVYNNAAGDLPANKLGDWEATVRVQQGSTDITFLPTYKFELVSR